MSAPARSNSASADGPSATTVAERLHATRFFCPDGGRYELADDRFACSLHGSTDRPTQPTDLARQSPLGQLLASFRGLTATLTFEPEGLRAVVTVEHR